MSVTITITSSGRQWTLTDERSQVRHAEELAVRAATWLRDEEVNASAAMPASVPHACQNGPEAPVANGPPAGIAGGL